VKQTSVTSRYFHQCRKCSAGAAVGK